MTATQPGPLSAHWASTMSSRGIPSIRATRSTSASSTGPDRSNGGAANANWLSPRRIRTSPAAHSCTTAAASFGAPPISSHAWHVPSVGCPANGSSTDGVKIRTR